VAEATGARLSNFQERVCAAERCPFCMMIRATVRRRSSDGKNALHAGPGRESYVLVPVIPPKR